MRPLIQVVLIELEGINFIALDYFDGTGIHADQIVKSFEDKFEILDTVLDVMVTHNLESVDVETDNEDVYKEFIGMPGIKGSIKSSSEFSNLYRILAPDSREFPILQELYLSKIEEEVIEEASPSLLERFLNFIKNLFNKGAANK
ncbi:hypothetical protein [Bacillus sp. JJ1562]|uniref:hypothetical protein n=1 Tax=Bacillus sp. JJ1562 TaxID=3122960 RepID=UPI003003664F